MWLVVPGSLFLGPQGQRVHGRQERHRTQRGLGSWLRVCGPPPPNPGRGTTQSILLTTSRGHPWEFYCTHYKCSAFTARLYYAGLVIEITELLWDEQNIAHIGRHTVTPDEVGQVVFDVKTVFFDADNPARPGRLVAFGQTASGRFLTVYLDTPVKGRSYPVTARPMTTKEEWGYRATKEADDG